MPEDLKEAWCSNFQVVCSELEIGPSKTTSMKSLLTKAFNENSGLGANGVAFTVWSIARLDGLGCRGNKKRHGVLLAGTSRARIKQPRSSRLVSHARRQEANQV